MPPLACPHCKKVNPDDAVFCFFDGMMLKGQGAGKAPGSLAQEFVFPSGRQCKSYDELVAGCQEEWLAARDMLKQGVFQKYFTSAGRLDLVKASEEAAAVADPDIGLTNFLGALPASVKVKGPKLDVNPHRLNIGKIMGGETRKLQLKIQNVGQGVLQGTLSVTEGQEWLHIGTGQASNGQIPIKTSKEQIIPLTIDTRELAAGEPYAGKIRIITNGGVLEIPARIDVGAKPFPRAPFQGAKNPREMAMKMRDNPKAAVALLESGELPKWFSGNGWTYPVGGTPAPGVAGVQQFFEAMGLAKPPQLQLSPHDLKLVCRVPDRPRQQVTLSATSKKWVYANVSTDAPWLNILTPSVAGPQKTVIALEVDSRQLPAGKVAETVVQLLVNGGQKMPLRVRVDIQRATANPIMKVAATIVFMAFTFFWFRLLVSPLVDFYARSTAVQHAANRSLLIGENAPGAGAKDGKLPAGAEKDLDKLKQAAAEALKNLDKDNKLAEALKGEVTAKGESPLKGSPAASVAGWLQLPWLTILSGLPVTFPEGFFGSVPASMINQENFRDFFVSTFLTIFVGVTWWIGAVIGAVVLLRKNGLKDAIWGLLSGAVLGVIVSASLGCLLLLLDLVPGLIWHFTLASQAPGIGLLIVWIIISVICWTIMGGIIGFGLKILGPFGRPLLGPIMDTYAGLFRLFGMRGLAAMCS
jgi:hypothetical protein